MRSTVRSNRGDASSRAETPQDCPEDPDAPRFLRIILGSDNYMPLAMARDILAAIKEDISIFDAVKTKFSDEPNENSMDLNGLSEELQETAMQLDLGQVSEVIGTEAGMQILLRIS